MQQHRNQAVALGAAILLLALLVCPAAGVALVLAPVLLFGLVAAPRSLWPASNLEPPFAEPVLIRAGLFQRPPPVSIL